MRARDRGVLVATAVCAIGAPLSAARWLGARTDALAAHLGTAAATPARIGRIDAALTGTVRLSDVALGGLIAADEVEASVALASLLAGRLGADEIRVAGPRVAVEIDRGGDSDLARLARKLVRHTASSANAGPSRLRRIVVSSGTLTAHVAGLGDLSAEGVELVPDAGGVRVITGPVRASGHVGPLAVELQLARSAGELALPHVRVGRVLAVGGRGTLTGPTASAPLRDVAIGRLAAGGQLELRATIDDDGVARPIALDVQPRAGTLALRGEHVPLDVLAGLVPRSLALTGAHASGSIQLARTGERLALEVDGALAGAAIDHRVLAPTAVPLDGRVQATLTVTPDAITAPHLTLGLGASQWNASGWWRRGAPASGQLDIALASLPCNDLLGSLPAPLRGSLDGMVLGGTVGGRLRLAVDLAAPDGDGVALTASIADGCRTDAEPPAADVARLVGVGEQTFADGSRAKIGPGEPGWLAVRQVPAYVAAAFVSAEDARFYDHAGFDRAQIARSLEIDLRERRLARGGSTISQQLIKNAFLTQRRSFDRKLQEAILTWRLEDRLAKPQILERYLNIIELGPRVFGVTAAARHWFDVAPRELTVRQAAFLAALTSEPSSMGRRVRRAGALDPDSATRVDTILRAMRRDGAIDAAQFEAARLSPLRFAPSALSDR